MTRRLNICRASGVMPSPANVRIRLADKAGSTPRRARAVNSAAIPPKLAATRIPRASACLISSASSVTSVMSLSIGLVCTSDGTRVAAFQLGLGGGSSASPGWEVVGARAGTHTVVLPARAPFLAAFGGRGAASVCSSVSVSSVGVTACTEQYLPQIKGQSFPLTLWLPKRLSVTHWQMSLKTNGFLASPKGCGQTKQRQRSTISPAPNCISATDMHQAANSRPAGSSLNSYAVPTAGVFSMSSRVGAGRHGMCGVSKTVVTANYFAGPSRIANDNSACLSIDRRAA